ncbi:MAG: hypothetical protein ACPGU7_02575 [Gammaproteobacteria bacterium]
MGLTIILLAIVITIGLAVFAFLAWSRLRKVDAMLLRAGVVQDRPVRVALAKRLNILLESFPGDPAFQSIKRSARNNVDNKVPRKVRKQVQAARRAREQERAEAAARVNNSSVGPFLDHLTPDNVHHMLNNLEGLAALVYSESMGMTRVKLRSFDPETLVELVDRLDEIEEHFTGNIAIREWQRRDFKLNARGMLQESADFGTEQIFIGEHDLDSMGYRDGEIEHLDANGAGFIESETFEMIHDFDEESMIEFLKQLAGTPKDQQWPAFMRAMGYVNPAEPEEAPAASSESALPPTM